MKKSKKICEKAGSYWSPNDQDKLLSLYNLNKEDVVCISKKLQRTPYAISCKLFQLGQIVSVEGARGYLDFKKKGSDPEYKKAIKKAKKQIKTKSFVNNNKKIFETVNNEIINLQKQLINILLAEHCCCNDLKENIKLMNNSITNICDSLNEFN
jgi:hypothetical protein